MTNEKIDSFISCLQDMLSCIDDEWGLSEDDDMLNIANEMIEFFEKIKNTNQKED